MDREGDDYHPSLPELFARDAVAHICADYARLKASRAAARAELARNQRALAEAEQRGVRVGLSDSLAAGNCEAGTRAFAARNGLDLTRWYSPAVLMQRAHGDAQRVRLAILAACRRHDRLAETGAEMLYPAT